jgi:protein-S-isoprenylcysteine O-methyltransferase Ste14
MTDWAWIESGRYYVALLLWITLPPAVFFWLIVHPLAAFWRRLGATATFLSMLPVLAAVGYGFWLWRDVALAMRYPFRWPFVALGLALYALAIVIEVKCRRHLALRILVGVPEFDKNDSGRLLTEGIYAHTRNPRYLDIIIGLAGWSLVINFPAIYWLFIGSSAGLYLVVLLEERELRSRFGAPYDEYCRSVPRFVPRSWSFLRA